MTNSLYQSRLQCCFLLLLLFGFGSVQGQGLPKSLKKLPWIKEKVYRGLQFQYVHTDRLFASKQYISILKCNRSRTLSLGFGRTHLKPTTEFALESNALAAINAGFFNMKEGGSVTFIKVDDVVINENTDASERITRSCLAIDEKGRLSIPLQVDPEWYRASENYDDVLFTGPLLMRDGNIIMENEQPNDIRHPRSCACTRRDGNVLLITVDGRNEEAQGMTLYELSRFMKTLKCEDAINLDGGGSTTMYIANRGVVNHPSDNKIFDAQGERKVANVLLVH